MLEEITMRQLKLGLNTASLRDKLPCKLTSDSQAICILLPVRTYNQLVLQYTASRTDALPLYNPLIHKVGDRVLIRRGRTLVPTIVPETDDDGREM